MSQLILSLISGILIAGVAGYLGTLMLARRMTLVVDPLGHLALPGAALALIYGFDLALGAFPFIILGMVLIWFLETKTKLPVEALTAIVFSAGVAIALLFLPLEEAEEVFFGNILNLNLNEVIIAVVLCLLIFFIIKKIYSQVVLINTSEDLAKAEKINVKKYNFLYLLTIAIIIALGVKMVGGLLTAALVAIPASSARNLARNLSQYRFLSTLFGILSAIFGILLFNLTNLPAGPLIIVVSASIFLISILFKKKM